MANQSVQIAVNSLARAAVNAASSGDNTLVAAVSGAKIKVLEVVLVAASDVNVRFESGAGGTALTGVMSLLAAGDNALVLPLAQPGYHWFETVAGALLNLELSGAVQVSGLIVYYTE